jgi:hypothetical protein
MGILMDLVELLVIKPKPVRKPKQLDRHELNRICPDGCAEVGEDRNTGEFGIFCKKEPGKCIGQSVEHNMMVAYGVYIDNKFYCRPKCMFAPNYKQNYIRGKK